MRLSPSLARRALAEFVGTAFLALAVVGSGIAAARLSPTDPGLQLLENALATGAALVAVILMVGPVSGAHLNPVVTVADRVFGGLSTRLAVAYCGAQTGGACVGVIAANLTFERAALEWSKTSRADIAHLGSETIATLGLVLLVLGLTRSGRATLAPVAVGAYIAAAYFFASSTSFANPALTIGRALTDTFAGISPRSVPGFLGAQVLGCATAIGLAGRLYPVWGQRAAEVVVQHPSGRDDG